MITITVNKEPWEDHDYTLNTTFSIGEDATAHSAIRAFVDALSLESYCLEGIRNSLAIVAGDLEDSIESNYNVMQERI